MKNLLKTQIMELKVKIQLMVGSIKEEKFLLLMMLISYKAVGRSKKERLYGLGSEGHVLTTTKSRSFVAPQPTQLLLMVNDIVAAHAFKTALAQILDEHDHQNAEHQCDSEQQIQQLRAQLTTILNTLTAFGTQNTSNLASPISPNAKNPPTTNNTPSTNP